MWYNEYSKLVMKIIINSYSIENETELHKYKTCSESSMVMLITELRLNSRSSDSNFL